MTDQPTEQQLWSWAAQVVGWGLWLSYDANREDEKFETERKSLVYDIIMRVVDAEPEGDWATMEHAHWSELRSDALKVMGNPVDVLRLVWQSGILGNDLWAIEA